jgi:pilus assembly protein Flp/PilA
MEVRVGVLGYESCGKGGGEMRKAITVLHEFKVDEDGAALIEYTVLLGILLIAVITTIGLVGTWVSGRWTALNAALPAAA